MEMAHLMVPIIIFAIFGGIIFHKIKLYWRYNDYSINEKALQIKIKGETIRFRDIAKVTVDGDTRSLSLGEYFLYGGKYKDLAPIVFDRINFELKNGEVKYLETRYRERCYKVLKTLSKYIRLDCDLNEFKPPFIYPFEFIMYVLLFIFSNNRNAAIHETVLCFLALIGLHYVIRNYLLK